MTNFKQDSPIICTDQPTYMLPLEPSHILSYATAGGSVYLYDIRIGRNVQSLSIGSERGIVTSMAQIGPSLALGTASGYFMIHDLRFKLLSSVRYHSKSSPFFDLKVCNANVPDIAPGPSILSASGSDNFEVALWNLQSLKATALLSIKDENPIVVPYLHPEEKTNVPMPEYKFPPNQRSRDAILRKYLEYTNQSNNFIKKLVSFPPNIRKTFENFKSCRSVLCCSNATWIISGGSDTIIRYWNLTNPSLSLSFGSYNPFSPAPASYSYDSSDYDPLKQQFHSQLLPDLLVISQNETLAEMGGFSQYSSSVIKSREFQEVPTHRSIRHRDDVLDMSIMPTQRGNVLVSGGRDGSIRFWN
jgi:WD40 repeat protein